MKADVTNTWGLFCCFCKHRCFCCSNRNYQYKSKIKSLEWKRYIDDVFSSWDAKRNEIDQFILEANRHHPTTNFPAETKTLLFSKARDSTRIQSFTSARILNRLKSFNTRTTLPVTLQLVNKVLAEIKLTNRRSAFEQKPLRAQTGLMPFATQYNPSVPNVKNI